MQFYVSKNGEQLGPLSLLDVRERLKSGSFAYTDLAWRDGMKDWAPLSELMGGGLPDATPHAVSTWTTVTKPKPKVPTVARIVTAVMLFVVLFVVIYFVTAFLAFTLGGAIAGARAAADQGANGFNQGYSVGFEAGQQFRQQYGHIIVGCSMVLSLVVSPLISWRMAFSNLFPWCRPQ